MRSETVLMNAVKLIKETNKLKGAKALCRAKLQSQEIVLCGFVTASNAFHFVQICLRHCSHEIDK